MSLSIKNKFATINAMEIAYVDTTSIRIKGKQVLLLVNPSAKNKVPVDATVLTGSQKLTTFFGNDSGVLFQGSGEYEVKGTKVTGFTSNNDAMYTVMIDGVSIFVGTVTAATAAKDKLHEHNVAVLFADSVLGQTTMGVLNPSVILFLGEQAEENAKTFGKEFQKVGKYATTKEKLPSETEFVFLG